MISLRSINIYLIILTAIFFITSCTENKKIEVKKKNKPNYVLPPSFNADSAYFFVKKQVDFGPRVLSSLEWKSCSDWLVKKLKNYTENVIVQNAPVVTYDNKKHTIRNIIASFHPMKKNRIMLCAHWDSRHIADHDSVNKNKPILGANDGGSGVGVLLEIARQINLKKPNIGVDIILFDAEDYGQPENSKLPQMRDSWCLGSQYWSKNPHEKNYFARYGILLDMVGGKNATFGYEQISRYYALNIIQKVWKKAHQLGYGKYFVFENTPQILDDHYYVNMISGIPTINIIEYDPSTKHNFNKHWHTHQDDMRNISKETLKAVGQTVIEIIYLE